ncbi:MAG: response regulator [Deltaproteobacteria bacterium]|nr:response regulator [Deltaproteobacteria bacterium]
MDTGQAELHVHEETPRVLVVDDEKVIREILADFLSMEGFWVRTAEDGTAALAEMSRHSYDLVISDLKMPRMGGLELLETVSRTNPNVVMVIMTGFGTVETAIDAMKKGAYDYILKPFKVEEVVHIVQRGLEKRRLAAENVRLREAISLYKVSEAIAQSLSLDEVFDTVLDTAMVESAADVVTVLVDDREGSYVERSRRVRGDLAAGRIGVGSLDVPAILSHFQDDRPLRFHGPKADRFVRTSEDESLRARSIVSIPMRIQGRTIGFLNAISYTEGRKFDEGQRKVLSILANRASASIENARLYEDLKATFQQTIHGLARALDKMDRYTAGHSDRVTHLAAIVAKKLVLPHPEIEVVRQSGLMHDIGKIGVHANLNKPGKLSQEEYEIFKLHPVYGREILDPIKFLHPLIPGVHMHHERWDGRGYPLGRKGTDIPLSARILAVADTYDAMTSDRAYRRALPHEVAMTELERCAGSQFDPECVAAFSSSIDEYRDSQPGADGEDGPEK